MSVVTNVILTGLADERAVLRINRRLEGEGIVGNGFVKVDGYSGGNKAMEADVWLCAFNYLNLGHLVEVIRSEKWNYPKDLAVFVKEQEDNQFRLIEIWEGKNGKDQVNTGE